MKIDFIPKVITLSAGAVVAIVAIVRDMDTTYSLEILLATLIIFYIIGLIAKLVIKKAIDGRMFVKRNIVLMENVDDTAPGDRQAEDEAAEDGSLS